MEHQKSNTHSIAIEGSTDVAQTVTVTHEPAALIEMPEHMKVGLPESSARVVGREIVSRAQNTGRYDNGVVEVPKPAGDRIDFAGFDAHRAQARQLDVGDARQRETSMTNEEIDSV